MSHNARAGSHHLPVNNLHLQCSTDTHTVFSFHLHHLLTWLPSSGSCAVLGGGRCGRRGAARAASVIKRPRLQTPEVGKKHETDGSREPIREQKSRELVSSDTLTCCLRGYHGDRGCDAEGRGVKVCFYKSVRL